MTPKYRRLSFASLFTAILCSACSVTVLGDNQTSTSHTPVTTLAWVDSGFGPEVSPVAGNFAEGMHVTYVKFPAGMVTPIHTHTEDYVGIVVTGVSMHWEPGKPETKKQLSPGSHWFIGGGVKHVSECLPGTECVMAIYQQDAMDFLPEQ